MLTLKSFVYEAVLVDDVSGHKPIVIAPGRFNPPHRGHKLMVDNLIKLGEKLNAEPVVLIIDSGKYGPKNPLTGEIRKKYLEKLYPGVRMEIAKNPYEAVENLANEKLVPVGGVSGSDRADSYKKMIGRMFGKDVEEKYEAKVLARDPDAEGDVAGVSATKAREAAKNGNLETFRAMTGLTGDDAKHLMALVKKGMGVS